MDSDWMYSVHKKYPRKPNVRLELFEMELNNLLYTLEKLCIGNEDHIDYVNAYRNFVETWGPKDER